MYCKNCGREINDTAIGCPDCTDTQKIQNTEYSVFLIGKKWNLVRYFFEALFLIFIWKMVILGPIMGIVIGIALKKWYKNLFPKFGKNVFIISIAAVLCDILYAVLIIFSRIMAFHVPLIIQILS